MQATVIKANAASPKKPKYVLVAKAHSMLTIAVKLTFCVLMYTNIMVVATTKNHAIGPSGIVYVDMTAPVAFPAVNKSKLGV